MSTTPSKWSQAIVQPVEVGSKGWSALDAQELRRRASHMLPGLLPFVLWAIPHKDPLSSKAVLIFFGIFVALTGFLFVQWSKIARSGTGSTDRLEAIFGYACAVMLTIILFPAHPECGMAVLGVLAFGDGSATLTGKVFGVRRLPWNNRKTVAGFLGFLAIGLPVTTVIYWGESSNLEAIGPSATIAQAAFIAGAGVLAGAIAESIESRVNDNVRVGMASAVSIVSAHAMIFGL